MGIIAATRARRWLPVLTVTLLLDSCGAALAAPGNILASDDFERGNLGGAWDTSGPGEAGTSRQASNSGERSMYLGERAVTVTSRPVDLSGVPAAVLSAWVRRGDDGFSENPDAGEDLRIEYLGSSGGWSTLAQYPGDGSPGEVINAAFALPADAHHAGFRVRFAQLAGSGNNYDYWHVDDVAITEAAPAGGGCDAPGVLSTYFDQNGQARQYFTGNSVTRVDATIDFDWSFGGSPDPAIGDDDFTSRWEGYVEVPATGDYVFRTRSDDGIRLWIDGNLIIDEWNDHAPRYDRSGSVPLSAGQRYELRMEHYERGGQAVAELYWDLPGGGTSYGIIPADRLFHCPAGAARQPIAHYTMDEGGWSGAGGAVVDASGNGNDGTAVGAASGAHPGRVCNGGMIPQNLTSAEQDAVDTGVDVDGEIGNAGSISFWYRSTPRWRHGGHRTLFDASVGDKYFYLVLRDNTALRFALEDSSDGDFRFDTQGNNNFDADTWVHVAVTWDMAVDEMQIFVNGSLERSHSFNSNGTLGNLGTLYLGDNRSDYHPEGSPASAHGTFDEVRIYNYVQTEAEIQADMNATRACAGPGSFDVDPGGTAASTCFDREVAFTARDAAGNVLSTYAGTVTLTTSSGHGDWRLSNEAGAAASDPAQGVLDNGTPDDGIATYAFSPDDQGTVSLYLSNDHADDVLVRIADVAAGISAEASTVLNFRDNAFVITPATCTGPSCAGPTGSTELVAGRPHAFTVALWRRDATAGPPTDCAIATGYTSPPDQALKAWRVRHAQDPGGLPPRIGAAGLPDALPGADNITLSFNNGVAGLVLDTEDVGRYTLHLRDDSSGFARDSAGNPLPLEGSSATLTVRPFALGYSDIEAGGGENPGGTATAGSGFVAAGDPFVATLGAYRWAGADDADGDGLADSGAVVTDNGSTPSFAWNTDQVVVLHTPPVGDGGVAGILGGSTALTPGDYSGGQATLAGLSYSEVGSMRIQATASGYLGSGYQVSGTSPVVGRFYPAYFTLRNPSLGAACATGGFSYMEQPGLQLAYTLDARNRAGGITVNYDSALYDVGQVALSAENGDDGNERVARLDTALPASWLAGSLTATDSAASFARSASGPDGPFDALQIGVRVSDPDGALLSGLDMNADTTGDCVAAGTCTARSLGTTRVRHGRLALTNAHGSELVPLPMGLRAEYYDGVAFVQNHLDDGSCTSLSLAPHLELCNGGPCRPDAGTAWGAGWQAGDVAIAVAGGTTTPNLATPTLAAGEAGLSFRAPGTGNTGHVDVRVVLTGHAGFADDLPWLLHDWGFDWDGDGSPEPTGPVGRASFGIHAGSPRHIDLRELY